MRILGAAVVLLLLAGCTSEPPVEPVETETPVVEPVTVEQPAQVFDGDCAAIFSDAALSEALGQPLTEMWAGQEVPADWLPPLSPESLLVEQVGGVHCSWSAPSTAPDDFPSPVLVVAAVPASAVSAPEDTDCVATDMSATGCPIDVTANGIRLSGLVTSDLPGADPRARVAAVEALFLASASGAAAPATQTPLDGAWQTPADCASIAASLDRKALGEIDPISSDDSMGTDAYASVVEVNLRGGRYIYTCSLNGETFSVSFSLLGGGAWNRDAVLAQEGAEVVDLTGYDLVVESPRNGGTIDIFDGVNWLHSEGNDPELTYPSLRVVVDALNAP